MNTVDSLLIILFVILILLLLGVLTYYVSTVNSNKYFFTGDLTSECTATNTGACESGSVTVVGVGGDENVDYLRNIEFNITNASSNDITILNTEKNILQFNKSGKYEIMYNITYFINETTDSTAILTYMASVTSADPTTASQISKSQTLNFISQQGNYSTNSKSFVLSVNSNQQFGFFIEYLNTFSSNPDATVFIYPKAVGVVITKLD